MKLNKKVVKHIAIGVGIGIVVGAAAVVLYGKSAHLLKEAKWTPQGDMILTFFHRRDGILIPKFEGYPCNSLKTPIHF